MTQRPNEKPPFADVRGTPDALRSRLSDAYRMSEAKALPPLLAAARLPPAQADAAQALAHRLATQLRQRKAAGGRAGLVQALLQEYALSSQEGVALMCLAEALLRVPDSATRDALIRDKIAGGQWQAHAGRSPSVFVNAATWGLLLTGKLVATHSEGGLATTLTRLIGKGGEPLIRKGVDMAMRVMGEQFVTGETIQQALTNAGAREADGFGHSYDMLGETALTAADAEAYRASYEHAIHAIGNASAGRGVQRGPGISVKLSALHPRYVRAQRQRVLRELYPVLRDLTLLARRYDIGLNIDAEEADRLDLSLDLLTRLCSEPALAGWNGIGFVVQAYQKRCPSVIDVLVDLARRSGHRLMVRLVKGAYWDSEIKRAQVDGQDGYPVFTRKAYTDVSYLACARKLLAAPDAVYPQFATHNAQTLASIHEMAGPAAYAPGQYEFQCLHGMGEPLYEQVVRSVQAGGLGRPCRIYAPVGTHETLLAYLVRRLLENGANTSFVNRIADAAVPLAALVQSPVDVVEAMAAAEGTVGLPHPLIALPAALYGNERANSAGIDLSNEAQLAALADALQAAADKQWQAAPLISTPSAAAPVRHDNGTDDRSTVDGNGSGNENGNDAGDDAGFASVANPADHRDTVGRVREATDGDVQRALQTAADFAAAWAATPPLQRAAPLDAAADALQAALPQWIGLLMREAGKTAANAISEVREAVDFLRFYAAQCRRHLDNATHAPLGAVVCISPWNFPLAIFTGQIAAALAAGNTVLAKPAEQTPLIAAEAVRVLWRCGVPSAALQLLTGRGEVVGAALVADARTQGVLFTGSTDVARILQRTLAERLDAHGQPVTLIAETGGQNAMVVDSSALAEQVVTDVVSSAFDSAGQRCSALRLLCVQDDAADHVLQMLRGAMAELRIGDPCLLQTDVGPVIDAEAAHNIEQHIAAMRAAGRNVFQATAACDGQAARLQQGTFVAPTLIELQSVAELQREIFGPVLHVVRYRRRDLDALLQQIQATGYGLTLGLHTRIDETIARVVQLARAGNVYVNRNMVGAVVGVQPFGGEGLSGTGPKAGGPLYLLRLLSRAPADAAAQALAGLAGAAASTGAAGASGASGADSAAVGARVPSRPTEAAPCGPGAPALAALRKWADDSGKLQLADLCGRFASQSPAGATRTLRGPTGESNVYTLQARQAVLCLADDDADRLVALAAVLAVGSQAVWPANSETLRATLPPLVGERIVVASDWSAPAIVFDAVVMHGGDTALLSVCRRLAARSGPIVGVQRLLPGATAVRLERLLVERSLSINTAAAGGNASLMTIG